MVFIIKFFCGDAKFTLAVLGHTRQSSGEDLDLYVRRFHERAPDCCVVVNEKLRLIFSCMVWLTNIVHGISEDLWS